MDVSYYQSQVYGSPPCWELVADVYRRELDLSVLEFKTIDNSVRAIASAFRLALHKGAHGFMRITESQDLCVVLLGRTERTGVHHCGIYYQGRVLHALKAGTLYQDMASLTDNYRIVEFWAR